MHNKKIIAKGLVFTTTVVNMPIDSLANTIEEVKITNTEDNTREGEGRNSIKKFFAKIVEPIEDLVSKPKEVIKVNKNIVRGSVLQINLGDNDFVQDLSGNPGGYETVRVTTTGDKKLVKEDYDKLRLSGIPKVDLSDAWSDSIPAGAFSNATHLTEFKFPQGIKSISLGASNYNPGSFYNCKNLTGSLTVPNSVTTIGTSAFEACSGFNGNLTIPNSVTTIGTSAFGNCIGFTGNLTIPNSVTTIGTQAFYGCRGFTGNLTISNSVTTIGNYAFGYCSGFTGSLTIPNSVTSIGQYAFYGCSRFNGSLTIPDSVTSIGQYAFRECSGFTGNLTIPNSVTTIGTQAFYGCSGFTGSLTISNSVTTIGTQAFSGCSGFTGNVLIPDSVSSMGASVFYNTVIEKIIIKVDEGDIDSEYRKSVIENMPLANTYVELSYNLDINDSWLESSNYIKAKPTISTYAGNFENNEGMGISLEVIEASLIKTMTILKDGESYNLEKSDNGKYMFSESGDYQVYIETELGTMSNIEFKNISPINSPNINIFDNGLNIVDNGILVDSILENFDNPDDLKFSFSNSNWNIENGTLKSEIIGNNGNTETEFIVNAKAGEKVQIRVKTSSENNYDWGYIYLNGSEAYKKSGTSTDFEVLEFDLQEGENNIKFKYSKDSSSSSGSDAMFIDYIKILKKEVITIDCDTLEYRIDGGDWQIYTDSFELNYPVGTKLKIEVRAKHDGFTSTILSQEVTVEMNTQEIEEAIEKAVQSRKPIDISTARDLVNNMPESSNKDTFQDRLNAIHHNLTLDKQTSSASLDLYIKSENMLSLSLDTNSVTFDNYSGAAPVEIKDAINITINSSLPYDLNAYMPTEILNSDGSSNVPLNIFNIKESTENNYQKFENTTNKVVLKSDCAKGNGKSHKIDLKLDSNVAHKADIYKTVIRFEAQQK